MDMKGWDVDDKGNVNAFPVTGWSTVAFNDGKAAGLRFTVAMDKTLKAQRGVQLALTVPQVRKLSQMLAEFADKLEAASGKAKK
jgi:hypothetical protein